MDESTLQRRLYDEIATFEIIDAHEHLPPEPERLARSVDVLTLMQGYNWYGLEAAGLSHEYAFETIADAGIPVEERWAVVSPYWEKIRHTSYARAALIAAKRVYGFDDINDDTFMPLTEAMRAANTPGIYTRILRDICNIRLALNLLGDTIPEANPLFATLIYIPFFFGYGQEAENWLHPQFADGATMRTVDDYVDAFGQYLARAKAAGVVGLKIAAQELVEPDHAEAARLFEQLRDGKITLPRNNALRAYFFDRALAMATELDLTVAVHTGYWSDFRELNPLHLIPMLMRHRATRFDIFHLGFPWVRETLMLAKGFPNVWINFCWAHIISEIAAAQALDEAIDLLPTNKVIAFGADYGRPVEKIIGHLEIARESIARVLARRVQAGRMRESQALQIAHNWLFDNAVEAYRLGI